MTRFRTILLFFLIAISLILAAGCTSSHGSANATVSAIPSLSQSVALYKVILAQPDGNSRFIHMDTDAYNIGEVLEFVVTNDGTANLKSPNDHPDFSVKFQTSRGSWATKMGTEQPAVSNATFLKPGESSKVYRFITTGFEPGRYRIVSDYGAEREFLIRASPAPMPTISCPPNPNATLWITIDAIADHHAGEDFAITGTTSVTVGKEMRYTIFAPGQNNTLVPLGTPISITPDEGICGNNTWSVAVELPEPGEYFIGIAEGTQKASAIKRFVILPASVVTPAARQPGTPAVKEAPISPTPKI
jgi:hypothetical protein